MQGGYFSRYRIIQRRCGVSLDSIVDVFEFNLKGEMVVQWWILCEDEYVEEVGCV